MSWLFDRLCELAAADRVEVIIVANTAEQPGADDASDLVSVLLRASQVPQLTIWVIARRRHDQPSLGQAESVDLDVLDDQCASSVIHRMLVAQAHSTDAALQIESDSVALVPAHRVDEAVSEITTNDRHDVHRLFATDQAGYTEVLGRLSRRGLGIAIGGIDPQASIKVPDMMGVTSIVDALVTLRSFAFGVRAPAVQETASVERVVRS